MSAIPARARMLGEGGRAMGPAFNSGDAASLQSFRTRTGR